MLVVQKWKIVKKNFIIFLYHQPPKIRDVLTQEMWRYIVAVYWKLQNTTEKY